MTVRNNLCDFCGSFSDDSGMNVIIRTGAGEQLLWDGLCRDGSAMYFKDLTSEEIVELIGKSHALLIEDPIDDSDSYEVLVRKTWIEDDAWRGRQEIMFRVMEAIDD